MCFFMMRMITGFYEKKRNPNTNRGYLWNLVLSTKKKLLVPDELDFAGKIFEKENHNIKVWTLIFSVLKNTKMWD